MNMVDKRSVDDFLSLKDHRNSYKSKRSLSKYLFLHSHMQCYSTSAKHINHKWLRLILNFFLFSIYESLCLMQIVTFIKRMMNASFREENLIKFKDQILKSISLIHLKRYLIWIMNEFLFAPHVFYIQSK